MLNPGVTLLGAHGFRTYQDATSGPRASIDLDLEVERRVETLRLAYLTSGLSWTADYAVLVSSDERSARVDGYASVRNNSGATYDAAEVQLLAGTIHRGSAGDMRVDALRAVALEQDRAPGLERAAFGDYHLYTVSEPLSLRSGEMRRIRLVGVAMARVEKIYTFSHTAVYHRAAGEPLTQPVTTSYRIARPEESDLGAIPLPAGQVRVYRADDAGRLQLLGMAAIGNMPKGRDLHVTTGLAFDIVGTRTQTDYSRRGGNVYESAWKIELGNASEDDVTVEVIERLSGDWTIMESTHTAEKLSATAVRFRVEIPAGGRSVLEYRVSVRT